MIACQIILVAFSFICGNYRVAPMAVTEQDADAVFSSLISEYKQSGQNGEHCFSVEATDTCKTVYIIREKSVFVPEYADDEEMKFDCTYCDNENCYINKKFSNEFTASSGLYVYISPVQTLKFPENLQMSELLFSLIPLWMPQGIRGSIYMEQDDYCVYINYFDENPYKSTIKYLLSPIYNFRSDKAYSLENISTSD